MELTAISPEAVERAKKIKVILFDVDGVLTDGGIWLFPAPSGAGQSEHEEKLSAADGKGGFGIKSANMVEAKGFHAHDGLGISLARIAGMKCGVITKRISETVALRARDLRLEFVYMGQAHKLKALEEIRLKAGVELDEIAYAGDDVVDLPVMRVCGLAIATANAREIVKKAAHYVTPHEGGHGAGRDVVDFILTSQGLLEKAIEEFLDADSPAAAAADIGTGNM